MAAGRRRSRRLDPVAIQVFRHLLAAVAEEMGVVLMRAAFSPNIKERRDFSCALTDATGSMVAQASHIPVHLGSVHVTAARILETLTPAAGDVVLLNDPYLGGTHLPDVTVYAPVFLGRSPRPHLGVLCRAHHADVGGGSPGSMGAARDLHGEGLVIPPVRLIRAGVLQEDVQRLVLANTRTPEERRGDLRAQLSALDLGRRRLEELALSHGRRRLLQAAGELQHHAARATRAMLRGLPDGEYRAEERLDGPGSPVLKVACTKRGGRLVVDFSGTSPAVPGPWNANPAITLSAVFYVVRILVQEELPTNSGCLRPVTVRIPEGSMLSPPRPAAVAMGNVETSQRVVDLLMKALAPACPDRMPAASQGTMNNLAAGGRLPDGGPFTFYETIAGGAGAGPRGPGCPAVQTHMTNTLNTPVEALETTFPVRVTGYHLRRGSGGVGRHRGGDGVVRELEMLVPGHVTLMATRRREGPPGLCGGKDGRPGRDRIRTGGRWRPFPAEGAAELAPGDRVRVATPGGGGFGAPGDVET